MLALEISNGEEQGDKGVNSLYIYEVLYRPAYSSQKKEVIFCAGPIVALIVRKDGVK